MFNNVRYALRFHWNDEDMPFGKWFGGLGGGFGPARFFERGVLKFVILNLLNDKDRHGYDIIQALEKKFHGFYSPSAGSVYPILQMLEDQDYVTSSEQSGKKVYKITEEGKKYLDEHKEEIEQMKSRFGHHFGEKHGAMFHELKDEVRQTAQLLFRNAGRGILKDAEKMKQVRLAFAHFRSELAAIFSEEESKKDASKES